MTRGLIRQGTKPETIVRAVMQQTVNYYGVKNQHHIYRLDENATVIIHSTRIGGNWVTYTGQYGTYQATIGRHNTVGKVGKMSDKFEQGLIDRYSRQPNG